MEWNIFKTMEMIKTMESIQKQRKLSKRRKLYKTMEIHQINKKKKICKAIEKTLNRKGSLTKISLGRRVYESVDYISYIWFYLEYR